MSTYLELSQKLRRECSVSGTGPTAVTGQTGKLADLVAWIADAYVQIQNLHADPPCWRWLRHGFTFDTTADDDSYSYGDVTDTTTSSAITRLSNWYIHDPYDPPKIYLTSTGVGAQTWLTYVDWEDFKSIYKIGTQNSSAPAHISIDPQNNLVLGPAPNDTYTVTGDYIRSAQVLAADGDTPEMPSQFHDLIVYYAMEKYGYNELAQEILSRASAESNRMLQNLSSNQLQKMRIAGPMA